MLLLCVVVLSQTAADKTRSCVIGAMRKSICDSLRTLQKEEAFISSVIGRLKQMPDASREYNATSLESLEPTSFVGIKDFPALSYNCHLDPQSFYGIYKWYLPALARHFRLSFGEIISVQTTFDCMAKSHYHFAVVAEYLVYGPQRVFDTVFHQYRGFSFGYFILQMMLCVSKVVSNPPSRFNDYKTFNDCPDYSSWEEACTNKTKIILLLWRYSQDSPKSYKLSHDLLMKCVHGAGALTINHSIGILSSVGLLPSWYLKSAIIKADSTYMKYFQNAYYMGHLDNAGIDRVANHLKRAIKKSLNYCISTRILENLLCKIYRMVSPTANDVQWKDLYMLYQPVIFCNVNNNDWIILHKDGTINTGNEPLICGVPWGDGIMNVSHLHENTQFPLSKLTSTKSVMSAIEKMELNDRVLYNYRRKKTIVSIPTDYKRPAFSTNTGYTLFRKATEEMINKMPIPKK